MKSTPSDSPLDRYKALTLRLHELELLGESGGPLADAIRDESDGPWNEMTTEEREDARRYSAQLWDEYDRLTGKI